MTLAHSSQPPRIIAWIVVLGPVFLVLLVLFVLNNPPTFWPNRGNRIKAGIAYSEARLGVIQRFLADYVAETGEIPAPFRSPRPTEIRPEDVTALVAKKYDIAQLKRLIPELVDGWGKPFLVQFDATSTPPTITLWTTAWDGKHKPDLRGYMTRTLFVVEGNGRMQLQRRDGGRL